MKILLVTMQYGYGKKENGLDSLSELGFKRNFEALGHLVIPFYYDAYLSSTPPPQKLFTDFCDRNSPDLIFILTYTDQFTVDTLDYLKNKYKTIAWFGDDTWRFDNYTSRYATHYTYCVTTDKFAVDKYHEIGQKKVISSQWAAVEAPQPVKGEYKYSVSFVGGYDHYRAWMILELRNRGIIVEPFGNRWPNGLISDEKMRDVIATSKISLNMSNSTCFDLRCLISPVWGSKQRLKNHLKTFLCPQRFKTPKYVGQIKARNFEIPYFGGFQLTDYVPSIEDYFNIGKEVVCYNGLEDIAFLINYYLRHDEERESIRECGHKRAISEHGYLQRIRHIIEMVQCKA